VLSARNVREICAFRKVLETAALEISMSGNPAGLLQDLEAIESRMRAALSMGDVRAYLGLDTDFHLAFFANCGNSYLQNAYGLYAARLLPFEPIWRTNRCTRSCLCQNTARSSRLSVRGTWPRW